MTIGRTQTGAIKIKTDTPKGRRTVSCACCGSCGFSAFSHDPTPDLPKFKYLTQEFLMPGYSHGSFDASLFPWYTPCAWDESAGQMICGAPVASYQAQQSGSVEYKLTQYLESGSNGCSCHVVRAEGNQDQTSLFWPGDPRCVGNNQAINCWVPPNFRAFSAVVEDAEWTTWQDSKTLKLYLNKKTRSAKWASTYCEGYDMEFVSDEVGWQQGPNITNHCPSSYLGCANAGGPLEGWLLSNPHEDGGFTYRERSGVELFASYFAGFSPPDYVHQITFTVRQTLHNTLSEIWGSNQLEMRP